MVFVPCNVDAGPGVPETETVLITLGVPSGFLINNFWSGQMVVLSGAIPFNDRNSSTVIL